MENPSGEKSDGLEIISVGTLYEGSWDKKYWSSSRGKDRYPYPIGYHAVRTHFGITYRMEIREGLKGPLFVITSTDGESCTGQTPDIAWESFQKKGGPKVKLGLGKRFSCRIDGVELFGFRNPLVQRLLRELVTNINGTAELSALSSSVHNGDSKLELEAQPPDSCTYPDLSPYLVKPQHTRKRSRKHYLTTKNSVSAAALKRFQSRDLLDDPEVSITRGGNRKPDHEERCLTTSTSDEDCQVHKDSGASAVPLDVATSVDMCHRSQGADIEGCNSLVKTEDDDGESMSLRESKIGNDMDLCAPDTLEVLQDDIADSASYKDNSFNVKYEPAVANVADPEGLVAHMHPQEDSETYISNESSEKNDHDSVGQELTNSMMTLLLPQALPLLKKRRKKRGTTSSPAICQDLAGVKTPEGNDELYSIAEAIPPGKTEAGMLVDGHHVEREGKTHISGTVRHPEFLSPQGVNSVIPDSLEDGQCGDEVIDQRPTCSDFVMDNRAPIDQKECYPDISRLHGYVGGDQEHSDFHVTTREKIQFFSGEVSATQNEKNENEILVCDSPPDCIFPDKRILLDGEPMDVPLNLDADSICPETHFGEDKFPNEELVSDCIEETPSLGPTFSVQSNLWTSGSESMPKCDITEWDPENNSARFRNKETVVNPHIVASSSEAANLEQPFPPSSSTKYMEPMNSEVSKTKLVKYQRRPRSTNPKLRNTNLHRESDAIALGNQDNIDTHRSTATGYHSHDKLMSIKSSAFISPKEIDTRKTDAFSSIQMPGSTLSNRNCNGPLTESIICRNTREDCVPETDTATQSVSAIGVGQASGNMLNKVSFGSETKPDEQQSLFNAEKEIFRPEGMFTNVTSNTSSEAEVVHDTSHDDVSRLVDMSTLDVKKHHLDSVNELDNCCLLKTEPNKDSENVIELLGCYSHPTPVLSILLSTHGDNIHICVLCGLLQERTRTLFIYKVPIGEQKGGSPTFLGYTSIVLPYLTNTFPSEVAFERSGWQLTPDGKYLVLPNSIKAPSCRSQSILCSCPVCKSDCLEENAVKVVHVKLGYVTPVVKLKTVESVDCILVCEPSHLVSAEKNGELRVWAMNSEWSVWVEEFVLPGLEYISPCIVELKRIPKCDSLIVGHDGFGNLGLWDVSKRILLSRFSATGSSVFQVLPIGFFSMQRKVPSSASGNVEEQIKEIMAATEVCFSDSGEYHGPLSSNEEDMAVWLLISADGDSESQYEHQANSIKPSPVGCWRLALLVKNTLILGSALDPRASAVDASSGYGVIGTSDGLVYIWEITTGRKLVNLPCTKGGRVSCVASDSKSGVIAVANEECQLLVYATQPKGFEKLRST